MSGFGFTVPHRRHRELDRLDRVRIGPVRGTRDGGASRITALVEGHEVWFESTDLRMAPVAEVFGSAFLIPALYRHAVLDIHDPVDPIWLEHLPSIRRLVGGWWKLPDLSAAAAARLPAEVPTGSESVLFFSGGADSLYTLLRLDAPLDRILLIDGFDFCHGDVARRLAAEKTLRDVARERGLSSAIVRTNIREHPLFERVPWEHTHGGVLAAVSHALDDVVGCTIVSSSVPQATPIPWGSHWQLDPLWSSSRRQVVHMGHELAKQDKLRAIADDPIAHRHLRICWENRSTSGNCSRCYKCLYARLVLAELGALDHFETLDGIETLARDFDELHRAKGQMRLFRSLMGSPRLPAEVRRAVYDLVLRTKPAPFSSAPFWRAAARRVIRMCRRGLRPAD